MRIWLVAVIFSLLLSLSVYAYSNTTSFCLDASVVQRINATSAGTVTENVTCRFGCSATTRDCNPNPYDVGSQAFLLMPIISFVLFYLVSLLKEEDWAIHILLLFLGFMFLVVPMGLLVSSFPSTPYSGLYLFLLTSVIVVLAYYILKAITRILGFLGGKK